MMPSTTSLPSRLLDPFGVDTPMGEALVWGDGNQAEVIVRRHISVCGFLFADFPSTAAEGFRIQRGTSGQSHAQFLLRRFNPFFPRQGAGRDIIEQAKIRGIHKCPSIHSSDRRGRKRKPSAFVYLASVSGDASVDSLCLFGDTVPAESGLYGGPSVVAHPATTIVVGQKRTQ